MPVSFPLSVVIRGDNRLGSTLGQAQKDLKRFGQRATSIGGSLTRKVSAPLIGVGAFLLKSAVDYERAINKMAGTAEIGGEQLELLKKQAVDLGRTTQFSPNQVASAQLALLKAGFDVQETYEALPGVLNLAAAAELEIGEAATLAGKMLKGFNLPAKDSGRLVDALAKGSTSAATSIPDLAQAFSFAGGTASTMNIPLEQGIALLAKLGDRGIDATRGGTAVTGMLAKLASESAATQTALAALKIDRSEIVDEQGNVSDLIKVVEVLNRSGATAGQVLDLLGTRSGPAMVQLMSAGADELRSMQAELENSTGTAQRIADANMAGAYGSVLKLASAVSTLAIAVGDSGLLDAFTRNVDKLTEFVNRLENVNEETLEFYTNLGLVGIAAGPVLSTIGDLSLAALALASGFGAAGRLGRRLLGRGGGAVTSRAAGRAAAGAGGSAARSVATAAAGGAAGEAVRRSAAQRLAGRRAAQAAVGRMGIGTLLSRALGWASLPLTVWELGPEKAKGDLVKGFNNMALGRRLAEIRNDSARMAERQLDRYRSLANPPDSVGRLVDKIRTGRGQAFIRSISGGPTSGPGDRSGAELLDGASRKGGASVLDQIRQDMRRDLESVLRRSGRALDGVLRIEIPNLPFGTRVTSSGVDPSVVDVDLGLSAVGGL